MESVANFVNEVITYGIISVSSALPIQSCHTDHISYQYTGQTYAISEDVNVWRKKPKELENKKAIILGGYENYTPTEKTNNVAAN